VVGTYNAKKVSAATRGSEEGVGALTYDAALTVLPK